MKNQVYSILTVLLFVAVFSYGQTSNEGMLYVSPDTKFSTLEDLDNTELGAFINDGDAYIYRSFNNDGWVDFYDETGLTRFIGSTPQAISGMEPSRFYNILFENASSDAPFALSGGVEAMGTVEFFDGIVDNDNFGGTFYFGPAAEHLNTSDRSHVDGPVLREGDRSFTYPIGDGGYYRFAGTSQASVENNYEAKYYLENSDFLYNHSARQGIIELIDDKEYWTIEPVDASEDVLITLSWREETTPYEIIEAPQEGSIHIVRWDEESRSWIDEGGAVNVDQKTVTTAVDKYGVFTLARVTSEDILPCDVVVYNYVTPNGDGINDYFNVDSSNSSCAKNINVQIFNRWGVRVYETENYGQHNNVFRGYSEGRATILDDNKLPTGTYFYILNYQYDAGNGPEYFKKAGYLYLNGN